MAAADVTTRRRGRPRKTQRTKNNNSHKLPPNVTKVLEIELPLKLLKYCIQTRCGSDQVTEVKATLLKHNNEEITIIVCRVDDQVNLQLKAVGDFPVITTDDRLCCQVKSIDLPPDDMTADLFKDHHHRTESRLLPDDPKSGALDGNTTHIAGDLIPHVNTDLVTAPLDADNAPSSESKFSPVIKKEVVAIVTGQDGAQHRLPPKKDFAARKDLSDANGMEHTMIKPWHQSKRDLRCILCKAVFSKKLGLKRHLVKKHYETLKGCIHGDGDATVTNVKVSNVKDEMPADHGDTICDVGSQAFQSGVAMIDNAVVMKSQVVTDITSGMSTPCPVCDKTLHHNSYLLPHVRHRHQSFTDFQKLEHLLQESGGNTPKGTMATDTMTTCNTTQGTMEADTLTVNSDVKPVVRRSGKNPAKQGKKSKKGSSNIASFDCPMCGMSYTDRKTILNHMHGTHRQCSNYQELLLKLEDMLYRMHKKNAPGEYVFSKCEFCQAERTGRNILKHLEICHRSDAEYSKVYQRTLDQYFVKLKASRRERKRAYESLERTKGKTYRCRHCDREFMHRPAKSNHENFRCKKNPMKRQLFECYKCGFSTASLDSFEKHKERHAGEVGATNACDMCSKKYETRAGLIIHRRKAHNISSRHPIIYLNCTQCDKKFYDRDHLNKHLATHSDSRPFQCELCGQQYKTSHAVSKHQRMIHFNTYKYHCDKCGHGVEKERYLKKHICGRVRRIQDQEKPPEITFTMPKKPKKRLKLTGETTEGEKERFQSLEVFSGNSQQMAPLTGHQGTVVSCAASVTEANMTMQELVDSFITANALSKQNLANYIQFTSLNPVDGLPRSNNISPGNCSPEDDILQIAEDGITPDKSEVMLMDATKSLLGDKFSERIDTLQSATLGSSKTSLRPQIQEQSDTLLEPLNQTLGLVQSLEEPICSAQSLEQRGGLVQYQVKMLREEESSKSVMEAITVPLDCLLNLSSGSSALTWSPVLNTAVTSGLVHNTMPSLPSISLPHATPSASSLPHITVPPITLTCTTLSSFSLTTSGMRNTTASPAQVTMTTSLNTVSNLPSLLQVPMVTSIPNLQSLVSASRPVMGNSQVSVEHAPLMSNRPVSLTNLVTSQAPATVNTPLSFISLGQAPATVNNPLSFISLGHTPAPVVATQADLSELVPSVDSLAPTIIPTTSLLQYPKIATILKQGSSNLVNSVPSSSIQHPTTTVSSSGFASQFCLAESRIQYPKITAASDTQLHYNN